MMEDWVQVLDLHLPQDKLLVSPQESPPIFWTVWWRGWMSQRFWTRRLGSSSTLHPCPGLQKDLHSNPAHLPSPAQTRLSPLVGRSRARLADHVTCWRWFWRTWAVGCSPPPTWTVSRWMEHPGGAEQLLHTLQAATRGSSPGPTVYRGCLGNRLLPPGVAGESHWSLAGSTLGSQEFLLWNICHANLPLKVLGGRMLSPPVCL